MKNTNESDSIIILLKLLLEKALALKFLYLACIIIFVAAAYFYNKYSPRAYELSATIGPAQENNATALSSSEMFRGLQTYNSLTKVEDITNSLNSFSLVYSVINKLNFEIGYFTEKASLFKQTEEVYMNSPVNINVDKSHIQPIGNKFYITILNDSTYRIKSTAKSTVLYNYIDNRIVNREGPALSLDTICKFNNTIARSNFKFSVSLKEDYLSSVSNSRDLFYFELYHTEGLTTYYLSSLKIEPVSYISSIINLQFEGNNIEKSIDFLNTYINTFLEENLNKKNKVSINTIKFIDSQISEISDSLVISESQLRNFRANNQVLDLGFQGQRIYDQIEQIEAERVNLEIQSRYYNYAINYLKTTPNGSGVVPPISANITDPIMNKLISDLIALNTERSSIVSDNSEKNLFLGQLDNKIKLQKQAIIESATNNLNNINITLNELSYRSDKLTNEISNLPRTEMNMVNIQRKFNLNDAIFTFLLQKRSEAAISLASNYPDYEILEPARSITSKMIKPKTMMNYFFSLFIGLLIPSLLVLARALFNEKVSSTQDIENLLTRPIVGIIYSNPKKTEAVVKEYPGSAIAESFRKLRSYLFLKLKSEDSKIILVTSSQPQDGKSFVAFNLAASIASSGYKTIIADCDLRRPVLHSKFMINNSCGISNYMTDNANVDAIINETSVENLFFIPAGPILPNPSELIVTGVLDKLITVLRTRFEYIIIDTPPVGLVADSLQLMKYANQILIVSRNNYTTKEVLSNTLSLLKTNNITNYEVIFNDLQIKKSPFSGYTNYYSKE